MVWIRNRLPASLSQTFAYDDGGNLFGGRHLASGFVYLAGTGTLAWDEANRLSQVINGAAATIDFGFCQEGRSGP